MCVCIYLFNSLTELQEFIKETDAGLQRELREGDHDVLVDIMGHLLAVRSRQRATDELFEPLKETIMLLETYGQKMPEQVYVQLEVSTVVKYHMLSISSSQVLYMHSHDILIASCTVDINVFIYKLGI